MPLTLYLPAHLEPAPSLTRRLRAAIEVWLSDARLGARTLRDEAHLKGMDPRLLADVGLRREDVTRGILQSRQSR